MKKVLAYSSLPRPLLDTLAARYELADFTGRSGLMKDEGFLRALGEAQGLIGAGLKTDRALLQHAPNLEVISSVTVGYDNYDVDALTERGILLCNTPDVLTETVADTTLALMLSVSRRIVELAQWVQKGHWRHSVEPAQFGTDLHGKTLGIVGMGRIGAAIAQRAHFGFDMPVLYHNRSRNAEAEQRFGARYLALPELLAASDFVVVVVPLTAQTEKLIGAREFAQMKRSAYFINVARGKVIDEAGLIDALQNQRIAGAGLDVFEYEPLAADSPLLNMQNVVAVPHIGSATHETRYAMAQLAVDNLIAALGGGVPRAMVNPQARRRR